MAVQIGDAGGIPTLVKLLKSELPYSQECAARALRNMITSDGCVAAVVSEGAVRTLVKLLRSPSAGVRESAVGALLNLNSRGAAVAITAAGAIPRLVEFLRSPLHDTKAVLSLSLQDARANDVLASAAGTLRNVAGNERGLRAAGRGRSRRDRAPLRALLRSPDVGVQESAAGTLRALAGVDDAVPAIAAGAGTLSALVALLRSPSADVCRRAPRARCGI